VDKDNVAVLHPSSVLVSKSWLMAAGKISFVWPYKVNMKLK